MLRGTTRRIETPLGTLYVTITEDDRGQPFEVFMSLGKAGGALMADVEAIGRLISLALRSGIPMRRSTASSAASAPTASIGLGPNKVLSVPDAVGIAIEKWMQEKQGVQQELLPLGGESITMPPAAAMPSVAQVQQSLGPGGGAAPLRAPAAGAHRRLSRLRLAARVRGRLHEVPCVRVLRVRLTD